MENRKIQFDRKLPDEKKVEAYKDLGKVMNKVHRISKERPSFRNRKYFLGILLIIIVASLVYLESEKKIENQQKIKNIENPIKPITNDTD